MLSNKMPRVKSSGPKVGELKRKLRALRETECPPISKMKKEQVIAEISKLSGKHGEEHLAKSLPEKALEGLRHVEAEAKERNVGRKREKALAGLREVETLTKARNEGRKKPAYSPFVKVNRTPEEQKKVEEDFEKHMAELRMKREATEKVEEEKPKKRRVRKAKKEEVQEAEIPVVRKHARKQAHPKKFVAPEPEPAGPKKRKLNTPEAKKKRFEKGSKEAKEYMASLRAKRK